MNLLGYCVIGIDPGKTGALSYRNSKGHAVIRFSKKKSWEVISNLEQILSEHLFDDTPDLVIENTHAFERDTPSNAYTFGRNAGRIIGAVEITIRKEFELVDPKTWQRYFSLAGKYATTNARKNAHRNVAQKIVGKPVVLEEADAILIAEYKWRTQGGK